MGYYRVEPLRELENMANKMRKFIDEFPESFSFEFGTTFQPRIDIVHDDASIQVLAELPGVTKENIHLLLENNVLLLKGEKKKPELDEKTTVYKMERNYGAFHRNIPIPFDVNPSNVQAKFENGILIITLAKIKQKEPEHINIEIK